MTLLTILSLITVLVRHSSDLKGQRAGDCLDCHCRMWRILEKVTVADGHRLHVVAVRSLIVVPLKTLMQRK